MAIWLTSDEHHHHRNVIKYCNRPFTKNVDKLHQDMMGNQTVAEYDAALWLDVLEMTETLIANHNALVKPEDEVYHLGDFSLSKRAPGEVLPRLNGIHHMRAAGNHDWCHPVHSKKPEKLQKMRNLYFDAGFKTIELSGAMFIEDRLVEMSHFPYLDPNPDFDQRYPQFRPEDKGSVLLHGHVHEKWLTKVSPKGSLMINVGVDVWGMKPVSLDEIAELIRDFKN